MDKKKILIINKFLHPNGGSETYIFGLGKGFEKLGQEVQYFGMEHSQRIVGNRVNSYVSNMDFHHGKKKNPLCVIYSREARKKLRVVLFDFKPDVVHLNNFNYQLTPSILYEIRAFEKKQKHKIKIIFTAHDYQLICPNHMMKQYVSGKLCTRCVTGSAWNCMRFKCIHGSLPKSFVGSLEAFIYRLFKPYRMIDTIICPSHFIRKKLNTNPIFRKKIVTIHNFIELDDEIGIDNLFDKNEESQYVLYFGRYSHEKGIDTLLNVVLKLPEIPFVFAGSGPMEHEVNELENVINKGFMSGTELTNIIRNAEFMIFPSEWYENCPLTVMESLSLGTPVIAANIGGAPELIRDGVNGELFTCGDADELLNKVYKLWNNPDKRSAYQKACNKSLFLSLEDYCQKLLNEVY